MYNFFLAVILLIFVHPFTEPAYLYTIASVTADKGHMILDVDQEP